MARATLHGLQQARARVLRAAKLVARTPRGPWDAEVSEALGNLNKAADRLALEMATRRRAELQARAEQAAEDADVCLAQMFLDKVNGITR